MNLYSNASEISKTLLNLGALQLSVKEPFTYASGLIGPIYCDNRIITGNVEARRIIKSAMSDFVLETSNLKNWDVKGILAMATGAIAMGAWVSEDLKLPMGYIRSSSKSHGKGKIVEGLQKENGPFIVIEDLVNQGSSLYNSLDPIKEDFNFLAAFAIVNYSFPKARDLLDSIGLEIYSLTNFENLIKTACDMGQISKSEVEEIQRWHSAPADWKP